MRSLKNVAIFVLVSAVLIAGARIINPADATAPTAAVVTPGVRPVDVQVDCEIAVKRFLVSPASMRTPRAPDPTRYDDGAWRYNFAVDSQNGFGALLRTHWICSYQDGVATVQQAP